MTLTKRERIRLGLEQSVSDKIHNELFKQTSEYQYLLYGMAQGVFTLYNSLSNILNNRSYTLEDIILSLKEPYFSEMFKHEPEIYKYLKDLINEKEELEKY